MRMSLALLPPLLIAASALSAQTVPHLPPPQPPEQGFAPSRVPEWTVQRAASAIEMLPRLRVSLAGAGAPGRARAQALRSASAQQADLGNGQFGVAFNHGMQAYGALSGEISFRLETATADGVTLARHWGLEDAQRIGHGGYWVARARSPQQLRDALQGLALTPGVREAEWVIVYGLQRAPIDTLLLALR